MSETARRDPRRTLTGILPPTTMPFDGRGDLVVSALREQMDFVVAQKAHGVVAGGSTGEGHTLNTDEFVRAMQACRQLNPDPKGRLEFNG